MKNNIRLDGWRKVIALAIIVIASALAAWYGFLTDQLVEIFIYLSGFFFAGNAVEHFKEAIVFGKKVGEEFKEIVNSSSIVSSGQVTNSDKLEVKLPEKYQKK